MTHCPPQVYSIFLLLNVILRNKRALINKIPPRIKRCYKVIPILYPSLFHSLFFSFSPVLQLFLHPPRINTGALWLRCSAPPSLHRFLALAINTLNGYFSLLTVLMFFFFCFSRIEVASLGHYSCTSLPTNPFLFLECMLVLVGSGSKPKEGVVELEFLR